MEDKNTDIYYKLGEMHGDIKNTLEEAKKTNGRVTDLEKNVIPKLQTRIGNMETKLAIYTAIAGIIIFALNFVMPPLIDKFIK